MAKQDMAEQSPALARDFRSFGSSGRPVWLPKACVHVAVVFASSHGLLAGSPVAHLHVLQLPQEGLPVLLWQVCRAPQHGHMVAGTALPMCT
jgi:hypothetical protein